MNSRKLIRILIVALVWASGVGWVLPPDIPPTPDGCEVEWFGDWNYTKVVVGWQGHDINRPYDSYCGVGVKVNGVWHSYTTWGKATSFADGTTINLLLLPNGVKAFEVRAPLGGHLDGSIVWDAIPGYVEKDVYQMYIPSQFKNWNVCQNGCMDLPPVVPTPFPKNEELP